MADDAGSGVPETPLILLARPDTGRLLLVVHGEPGEWKRQLGDGMLWIAVEDTGALAYERRDRRVAAFNVDDPPPSEILAEESGKEDKEIRFEVEPAERTDTERVVLARVEGVAEAWWRVLERSVALTVAVDVAVVPEDSGGVALFMGVLAYDSGFVQDRLERIPFEKMPEHLAARVVAQAQKIA